MRKVWIVSLQDGERPTYVLLDELPVVMEVDEEDLENPDYSPPAECVITDHIHIKNLLEDSVWKDNQLPTSNLENLPNFIVGISNGMRGKSMLKEMEDG